MGTIHRHRHSYTPVQLAGMHVGRRMAAALTAEARRLDIAEVDVVRDALEKRLGVPARDPPGTALESH